MFYLTTHSTHFIYGYMASDIWLRTILIVRKETRCRHIGYSYPMGRCKSTTPSSFSLTSNRVTTNYWPTVLERQPSWYLVCVSVTSVCYNNLLWMCTLNLIDLDLDILSVPRKRIQDSKLKIAVMGGGGGGLLNCLHHASIKTSHVIQYRNLLY